MKAVKNKFKIMKMRYPSNHIFKGILSLTVAVILSGCAKLAHMNELLTLKAISDQQDAMGNYVEKQDNKFKLLLSAVEDRSIEKYNRKTTIVRKFGDPVFCENVEHKGEQAEFCLYRYTKKYFNSDKVYFYFDAKGKLVDWEHIPMNANEKPEAYPAGNKT